MSVCKHVCACKADNPVCMCDSVFSFSLTFSSTICQVASKYFVSEIKFA